MKRKKYSSSSSEESDEEALINLKKQKSQVVRSSKQQKLYEFTTQICEFCDAIYYNRYDLLVHNAKHIIIPLINGPCLECTCGRYFSTGEDLQHHNEKDHIIVPDLDSAYHKQTLGVIKKDLCNTNKELKGFNTASNHDRSREKDLVKKCPVPKLSDSKGVFIIGTKRPLPKYDGSKERKIIETKRKLPKYDRSKDGKNNEMKQVLPKQDDPKEATRTESPSKGLNMKKELFVKCEDNLKEIIAVKNEIQLEKIIKKDAIVICESPNINLNSSPSKNLTLDKKLHMKYEDDEDKDVVATRNELQLDKVVKKEAIVNSPNKYLNLDKELYVNCEDNIKDIITAKNELQLENIIKTELLVECDNSLTEILNGLHKKLDIKQENSVVTNIKFIEDEDIIDNKPDSSLQFKPAETNNIISAKADSEINEKVGNLKSKLLFEEDLDDLEDDIIQLNNFDDDDNMINSCETNGTVNFDVSVNSNERVYDSIHYEELMLPGKHECRRCSKSFLNRYNLILHETDHISTKRNRPIVCEICDYYIAGNYRTLKNHMITKHHQLRNYKLSPKNCYECSLPYYNHVRHIFNYHFIYVCLTCPARFKTEPEQLTHMKICKGDQTDKKNEISKLIKVCDMCFSFFKNTQSFKYVEQGVYSRDGLRTCCERCDKPFFELKLVERSRKLFWTYSGGFAKKPKVTNESRLKNIQNRLKMINKRNRL